MYEIEFTRIAERYLKKIRDKKLSEAFGKAFVTIAENPQSGSKKSGDISNIYG